MLVMLYFIGKYFGVLVKLGSLVKIIFASGAMYIASLMLPAESYIFLLWSTLLFVLYLLVLYFLKEVSRNDLDILKELVLKKKK